MKQIIVKNERYHKEQLIKHDFTCIIFIKQNLYKSGNHIFLNPFLSQTPKKNIQTSFPSAIFKKLQLN